MNKSSPLESVLSSSIQFLEEEAHFSKREASFWAHELIGSCLGTPRSELFLDKSLSLPCSEVLAQKLLRAKRGEPLDYILGEKEFFGAKIRTDQRALIPRPETELLAEQVGLRLRGRKRVLDLCCGSGCLGISLKKKYPHLEVTLSDLSKEALSLARENAERNGVKVSFLQGDLKCPDEVDLIVCNPPYIPSEEIEVLDVSVKEFEPRLALDGGRDGLAFYHRLSSLAPQVLSEKGALFLEIGASQAQAVEKIFLQRSCFSIELGKDLSGKDRFFFLEKQLLSPVSWTPA